MNNQKGLKKATLNYLGKKESKNNPQKWIYFSRFFINAGFDVYVYEAKTTYSKYIYVVKAEKVFKVRFSNHKPNFNKEKNQDSDFYVGHGNLGITTTQQAIHKTLDYFSKQLA